MLLNSTKCKCGRELRNVKFDLYVPNFDKSFYGGRVDMYGAINCECGRTLKGCFSRNVDQTLTLIDLEVTNDITEDKKTDLKPTSLVFDEEEAPYIAKTYEEMSWNELKTIAKERGIKTNKGRESVIKQLRKN